MASHHPSPLGKSHVSRDRLSQTGVYRTAFEFWRSHFTNLGTYTPEPDQPLGRQAQDYVVDKGRETGLEHIVGIDKAGETVLHASGSEQKITFPFWIMAKFDDQKRAIAIQHNHPNDRTLSPSDISMLANPGIHSIWSHGHDGFVARAALTPFARSMF
jgi:hypothetical protein